MSDVETPGHFRRVILLALAMTMAAGSVVGATDTALAVPIDSAPAVVKPQLTRQQQSTLAHSRRVYIVGDSLIVAAQPYLRRFLRDRVKSTAVDAAIGRHSVEALRHLKSAAARRAQIWVIAIGTNDENNPSAARSNMRRARALAGKKRTIIWVNVAGRGYGASNLALAFEARRYANVSVLDWDRAIRRQPYFMGGDRIHMTDSGARAEAIAIAAAVSQAARRQ